MSRLEYVIEGVSFGEKECLTAFTPEAQLIEAFVMWIFGDAFIRAFYTIFEVSNNSLLYFPHVCLMVVLSVVASQTNRVFEVRPSLLRKERLCVKWW